jgi:radical SAM superfamily enzyme YgiQ (UPF0313 family)
MKLQIITNYINILVMKILLILTASPNDPLRKNDPFMPLSLPLIAASSPDHDYEFVDMLSDEKICYDNHYDLVGISYRISAQKTAFEIAGVFRNKGIKVIAGGPQPTCSPYDAAKHFDSVVVGEAEGLWNVLLNDYESGKFKKFYVCSPEKFHGKDESVHQIFEYFNLENEPAASRQHFKGRYDFDTIIASRGCPIDCDFCSVPGMYGMKTRFRKINDVVSEIDTFRNYYYILDDTVFGRKNSYGYYTELYQKIFSLKKTRFWTGQGNLDAAADPEGRKVITLAAKSGLLYAAIGIESINPAIIKKSGILNKLGLKNPLDAIDQMKENIRFIQEQGIIISGWFVVGYEEDNIKTFDEILKFSEETNILPIINPLEVLPNTRLYEEMKKENRISYTKKINIIHPVMNDDMIIKAVEESIKKGFSNKNIRKRTFFYMNKFEKDTKDINRKISHIIHKTIFAYILQKKLKKGVMALANTGGF